MRNKAEEMYDKISKEDDRLQAKRENATSKSTKDAILIQQEIWYELQNMLWDIVIFVEERIIGE